MWRFGRELLRAGARFLGLEPGFWDEAVREVALAYAKKQAQELLDGGAPGVHLYTLNKAEACLEIGESLNMQGGRL